DVVERRDVGRPLDRRVPAQRDDPASGTAHVPEQELHDGRAADVLHADRVLRPPDGVDERARPLASGVLAEGLCDGEEVVDAAAARIGDELGGVPGVVALEDLEDALRVRQRRVLLGRLAVAERSPVTAVAGLLALRREALLALAGGTLRLHAAVLPLAGVVPALLRVPPGEQAVEVLRVRE